MYIGVVALLEVCGYVLNVVYIGGSGTARGMWVCTNVVYIGVVVYQHC